MSSEKQQVSRQDLLTALEKGWKHYLSRLKELTEEEQAWYAQKQGFARLQDVLVHIYGWWELSMRRSFQVLSGDAVPIEDDMDGFNAEVVARYHQWTREAVEAKFATTLTVLSTFSWTCQRQRLSTNTFSSGCVSTPLTTMRITVCQTHQHSKGLAWNDERRWQHSR